MSQLDCVAFGRVLRTQYAVSGLTLVTVLDARLLPNFVLC